MFYVVITKSDSQAIYRHTDKDEAFASFYSELAYAYNQHINTGVLVLDKNLNTLKKAEYIQATE